MCFIHTTSRTPIKLENVEVKPSQFYARKNDILFTYRSKILCAGEMGFSYNNTLKDNPKEVPLEQILKTSSQFERVSIFYNKMM